MARPSQQSGLSRWRIGLAFAAAIAADGLQMLFTAWGWFGPDQAIDVVAMIAMILLLGFHLLLLPTFVLELIPGLAMIPTWTGCVAAVVALKLRQPAAPPPPPAVPPPAGATPPRPPAPPRMPPDIIDI
jgi:hypothetical protein